MAEEVVDGISSYISNNLGEAAKAWGNELALENGEELPEEDNQSMSDSAEEEPVEEFEQEEEYEEDEDEPEEQRFDVKSNGEVKSVTLRELQDNFSKGENYTQKSQGLSEDRKAFEQAHRSIDNPAIQEGLTASLRASFHGRAFADSGNFELNEQIASGVLCCLNANLFLGTGVATSPWLRRLYETTDEATDWIQSLLDGELDGEDLESTRRFEI